MNIILDKTIKEQENAKNSKQMKNSLLICKNCGQKMQDNSFKHGSRTGGSYECSCGNSIMF